MEAQNGEEFLRSMIKQYCNKPKIVSTTELSAYYLNAMGHFNKAIEYKKDKKDFGAYIELMRYADIVTAIKKTHCQYNKKKYRPQKELHQKRLSNVINELEKLKPELIGRYNHQFSKQMSTVHCQICFVELSMNQIHTINGCNHQFCQGCFTSYLKYEMQVSASTIPTCPHENCDTKLQTNGCIIFEPIGE